MLREEEQLMTQFSDLPVTIISNFQLGHLLKTIILFEILQTKIMRFDNISNTICRFGSKR